MPRNYVQHKFCTTVVNGFEIVGGTPSAASYEMDGKYSLIRAQKEIRKTNPFFIASDVAYSYQWFRMPLNDFKQRATMCGDSEKEE